ncbi:immunoglobulin iota chain [Labeo rohita]|nr:immunoglobulin iota chain [Labeo rohita]
MMKIIQLHIYLLMWSQTTESLTNIAVTLGADVNISCDLDIKEIYWYKQKSPDPPVSILRTYSSTYEGADYENSIFEDKYSVKTNSRLFIRNISTDELGVYYCVKTSESRKFSNGTKIYISNLLMWSQVTESLTNIAVTLGADVNISCDLDIEEIYWYKQKLPDPPVSILRTYSSTYKGAEYENSIFRLKYSVKTNSRLFIRNISTDELGVYYCVKTSEPLKFSNGTKIYISDVVQKNITVHMNQTESDDASQQQTPWRTVTITSVLLNVLLIIALIGFDVFLIVSCLVKSYIDVTGRSKNDTAAQNSNNLQCVEVDLFMCPENSRLCPEQSTTVLYCQ